MQLTNGNLFWSKNTKIIKKYEYLSKNITVDVLVVGGGISGAITAYLLSKAGLNVTVVEKNIVGYGSTNATTALLEYQVDIDMYKLDDLIGENYSKRIFELCKESITEIENIVKEIGKDVEFERKDALYYSDKKSKQTEMLEEYYKRKNAGYEVSYLTKDDILDLKCGIRTKDSSAVINPYLFTMRVFEYLSNLKNKVQIFENTKIVNVISEDNEVKCTTNNGFCISSKHVVFATGFETVKYIEKSNYTLYKTFTIVTNQIKDLKKYNINFTGRDKINPYHYIRFTKDNRIVYGGEDVLLTKWYENEQNVIKTAEKKYLKLKESLEELIKINSQLNIEYSFNGTFATTKDSLPLIDEINNMKNCYVNLGFGSNGILYSTIGAKLLTNYIVGKDTKDIKMFRLNRK